MNNDVIFNQTIGSWLANNAWLLVLLLAWSITWKGLALWKAARNQDKVWYMVLLVVNTVGLLEILYVFYFGKRSKVTDFPADK